MNFITHNYKPGNTLVPSKGQDNPMSISEITINKVSNSKGNKTTYNCEIKYNNGSTDLNVNFLQQKMEQYFSLKLKDLLSEL